MQQLAGDLTAQQYLAIASCIFALVVLIRFRSIGRGMAIRHAPVGTHPNAGTVRLYQGIWFAAGFVCLVASLLNFFGLLT